MAKKKWESVWIGLVGLTGPSDSSILEGCPGAFANFIAVAASETHFRRAAECRARMIGLNLDEVLWCEPLDRRLEKFDVDQYLLDLARSVLCGEEACFGRFHVWEAEE